MEGGYLPTRTVKLRKIEMQVIEDIDNHCRNEHPCKRLVIGRHDVPGGRARRTGVSDHVFVGGIPSAPRGMTSIELVTPLIRAPGARPLPRAPAGNSIQLRLRA